MFPGVHSLGRDVSNELAVRAAGGQRSRLERGEERDFNERESTRRRSSSKSDFPTDTSGLPRAVSPERHRTRRRRYDAELHIGPVVKRIGDATW